MLDENKIKEVFTNNLKKQMLIHNTQQNELAKYMGVSNTTVNNWVKGYKTPRMDKVDKLCAFFSVKRSDLIEDKPSYALSTCSLSCTAIEKELIKKYRTLDERGKSAVCDTLDREYGFVSKEDVAEKLG